MTPVQIPLQRLHNRVQVVVGPGSTEQVALSGRDRLAEMTLLAVKESGVELGSETFLPRNCTLEIEFRVSQCSEPRATAVATTRSVRGVVRRARSVTSAPSYALWVRPDEQVTDELEDWRFLLACWSETGREAEET